METERFIAALSRDRFDYTEWRRQSLPALALDELATACNRLAGQLEQEN